MQRLTSGTDNKLGGAISTMASKALSAGEQLLSGPPVQTSNFGAPIDNSSTSLNINGFPVSSDIHLFEKQQTFNRGKTLERMVHPCGSGAFGYFEVTKDMSKYCKAEFLNAVGKRTPVLTRFSTVTYGKEFPDSARNPRGFAVKFYTEEGNYDIVGLNFPIFFVRDPMQGPDVIRSQQRNPATFLLDFDSLFDFMANVPESIHCGTMFFSDYGTPRGWRFMHGYGCHTFKWVNAQNEEFYVKYHFNSLNGIHNFNYDEHVRMSGEDPDFAKRDLFQAIEKAEYPSWRVSVQIMPVADAAQQRFDPFDVTKVWSHKEFPLHEFGKLVLNKNPENYHRDIEQAAFAPGNLVPGIEPSPDMLLNFRLFFYRDAQFHRLGVNHHQIPVNCPFRTRNYNPIARDGAMRTDSNGGVAPHYVPNSFSQHQSQYTAPKPAGASAAWQPIPVPAGATISRQSPSKHANDPDSEWLQVRNLYLNVMSDEDRQHLYTNIGNWLKSARPMIQKKFLASLYKVHPTYAEGVLKRIGGDHNLKDIEHFSMNREQ
ncbi:hypothetical protein RI367_006032 [Sorochytrium milnesiophthora]